MLITCSLSRVNEFTADEKYFIVRSPGAVKIADLYQLPELSPSFDLFLWAQRQKKQGIEWWREYELRFTQEMKSFQMSKVLDQLERCSRIKDILLVCFCSDVDKCHRGIIANEMKKRGVLVDRQ